MKSKLVERTVLASIAIGFLFGSAQLMAEDCFSVKGKIINSSHDPALGSIDLGAPYGTVGGVSTVGVVSLNGGNTFGKLKCALVGVAVGPGEPQVGFPFNLPDFTHTISCDDSVEVYGGVVHSQLTFDTTGNLTGSDGAGTFFFTEDSVPVAESGKGVFDGTTTGGGLTIEGTINVFTKSIDMNFTGDICME